MAITLDGTVGITTADIAATTLTVNAGFGSNATAYGVRAWVNFNGTGTVAIRDSGNVSSITDSGVGLYIVNFTTAMPDADYSMSGSSGNVTGITTSERSIPRNGEWTTEVAAVRNIQGTTTRDDTYISMIFIR